MGIYLAGILFCNCVHARLQIFVSWHRSCDYYCLIYCIDIKVLLSWIYTWFFWAVNNFWFLYYQVMDVMCKNWSKWIEFIFLVISEFIFLILVKNNHPRTLSFSLSLSLSVSFCVSVYLSLSHYLCPFSLSLSLSLSFSFSLSLFSLGLLVPFHEITKTTK